ncbi:hypothetical protein ACJMK2_023758 [Sinanodonta woodiana]|uniref:N(6)-L-threonylcarbamoyladenine synthase n=1 Tax=Sinanodonta woodiana TaxID=1069815 RepID=A0ABD3T5T9_SINWO
MLSYCRYRTLTRAVKQLITVQGRQPEIRLSQLSTGGKKLVLGIETSCDDTGAAVVNSERNVLSDVIHSQTRTHIEMGGVIPLLAQDLHRIHIKEIVDAALSQADVRLKDLDAIAVTVKPGLPPSLSVGLSHAKQLVRESGVQMIPIHHMEAHALTVRLIQRVDFPFLVLLVSGGHCLLALSRDVEDFLLIGKSMDESPGDAFDKTARKLKLKNLPECSGLSGGASIELMAKKGNPAAFKFPHHILGRYPHCNFSFSGLKETARRIIEDEETKHGVEGPNIIPNVADFCASFQFAILHHLARRLQRALLFCDLHNLLPVEKRTLVVSGGVASNMYLREGLQKVCDLHDCHLICPPPKLCTDNGLMIAWNGMEKLLVGKGIVEDFESVTFEGRCPLGKDITDEVAKSNIKLPRLKLL